MKLKKNTKTILLLFTAFIFIGLGYASLSTSLGIKGNVKLSSAQYNITYTGSNITPAKSSGKIKYGGTTTIKLTPATGYYITKFDCTNGYTNNVTTGESATSAQTVTINNNKNPFGATCMAYGSNIYTATIKGSGLSLGTTSLGVTYGSSSTVKVTPNEGYYLKSGTCTNGYTITNGVYGVGNTSAQTITINNNNNASSSVCTFTSSNKYKISTTGSNLNFNPIESYVDYNGSASMTITPGAGYYLSSFSCSQGYTVEGLSTGTSATGAQTVTIYNNGNTQNSACVGKASNTYSATLKGNNVSFSNSTVNITYGSTQEVTLTPATGYYLKSFTCTNGYKTIATTGHSATSSQSVVIDNYSQARDSVCTATMSNLYSINISATNGKYNTSSLSVAYGETATVTITPNANYYLSSMTCTNGYTTTATTGKSATSAQTVTIKNNSNAKDSTCSAVFKQLYTEGQQWKYSYTGNVQSFTVPINGTYKLEVYGAQGGGHPNDGSYGNAENVGGKGGYSYGSISLTKGTNLYVVVGEQGHNQNSHKNGNGGYNGGGNGGSYQGSAIGSGGGGATHIATSNRGELYNYLTSATNYFSEILIVAGGGGGSDDIFNSPAKGGSGGGTNGGAGEHWLDSEGKVSTEHSQSGGTQSCGLYTESANYQGFGHGGNGQTDQDAGGGGGGWCGGSAAWWSTDENHNAAGGGGSGFINNVTNGSMTNGIREGHGYAVITLVSID